MNPRSPASTTSGGYPSKRARPSPQDEKSPTGYAVAVSESSPSDNVSEPPGQKTQPAPTTSSNSSSFRNVSACNRCRLRKNRCDQRLPSCASCKKAGVKCVGYDPITKREIPRSYVFYLETRVGYLEALLASHDIPFAPAEVLDHASRPGPDPNVQSPDETHNEAQEMVGAAQREQQDLEWKKRDESDKLNKLVSNVGMIAAQGASDPRYLGSTSGISFARVVFAAVKSSVSGTNSDKGSNHSRNNPVSTKAIGAAGTGTSMRDSFFGLQTKPTIKAAPFPGRDLGMRLVTFYFEHANPQVPILHRGEFMKMFDEVYGNKDHVRTPRESYMLNIVFAIGAGIYLGEPESDSESSKTSHRKSTSGQASAKRHLSSSHQCQPEEYHASAIVHLEACLQSTSIIDRPDGFGGGLEELQAVLLLAGFALLRPVAPGLWYIVGVAVRLAVDLGLHYEDGKDVESGLGERSGNTKGESDDHDRQRRESNAREKGRREWVRDFRRRLWWCTYSFDRLVSTCVGRPFGITDQVITTEFPSPLEDKYITPGGFLEPPGGPNEPSCKYVAYHYFRFRLLQSEILQVLQHQQAQFVRAGGANQQNPYMHTQLPSPFLSKFDSFRSWRIDIDRRLWEWKESAPSKQQTGVQFSIEFLELNYWQAVIMLYRQSLSTPPQFAGEFNTSDEVESPSAHTVELREDEERVFLKVAEAGQKTLRLYRQLHRVHLVNYTFLATHHLFMAGISFLYAIWHSPIVRSRLTMDEVDFTILAATSVLGDLIEKCPPAEACRDAFDRMSKATVQMCMSTTGFSSSASGLSSRAHRRPSENVPMDYLGSNSTKFATSNTRSQRDPRNQRPEPQQQQSQSRLPKPQFDMALNDLYKSPPINNGSRASTIKTEFANDQFGIPRSQMHSPSDYAITPPNTNASLVSLQNDTSAIDPSLLPSPIQNASQLSLSNANANPNNPPTSQGQNIPYLTPEALAVNNGMYQNFNDMDFNLNSMDFLQDAQMGGGVQGSGVPGLDLGFGLGFEGAEHDFSEGNQFDFFDGFYFGTGV